MYSWSKISDTISWTVSDIMLNNLYWRNTKVLLTDIHFVIELGKHRRDLENPRFPDKLRNDRFPSSRACYDHPMKRCYRSVLFLHLLEDPLDICQNPFSRVRHWSFDNMSVCNLEILRKEIQKMEKVLIIEIGSDKNRSLSVMRKDLLKNQRGQEGSGSERCLLSTNPKFSVVNCI